MSVHCSVTEGRGAALVDGMLDLKMKVLMDDDLPPIIAARLRGSGHDVSEVRRLPQVGNWVYRSLGTAWREGRLFVTTRQYFGGYKYADHAGILIVRLRKPNRERFEQAVLLGIKQVLESHWLGTTLEIRETTGTIWRCRRTDTGIINSTEEHFTTLTP